MYKWMQDPALSEAIGLSHTPTMARTLEWIEAAEIGKTMSAWAIVMNGSHVGNVVLDQFDRKAQTARLSMYIGEFQSRGKGIGTTAIHLALQSAFRDQKLFKVWLTVHAENTAAIRLYTKCGFQVEGTLRQAFVLCGRRLDAHYMGLLSDEFLRLEVEQ